MFKFFAIIFNSFLYHKWFESNNLISDSVVFSCGSVIPFFIAKFSNKALGFVSIYILRKNLFQKTYLKFFSCVYIK